MPYGMNAVVSLFEINCGIMTLLLMNDLPGKLEPKSLKAPIKISQCYFSKTSRKLQFFLAVFFFERSTLYIVESFLNYSFYHTQSSFPSSDVL